MGSDQVLASAVNELRLWRVPSERAPIASCTPHTRPINAIRWNHNGQIIATAGDDGRIVLSTVAGVLFHAWSFEEDEKKLAPEVLSLALSAGSRYVCAGSVDGQLKVWDLKRREVVKRFKGHTDGVSCVSFGERDQHAASGSFSGDVLLHNVHSGQVVASLRVSEGQAVKGLEFSPFRKHYLATCTDDGTVQVWDTAMRSTVVSFEGHRAPASGVAFSSTNQMLLCSAGLDKKMILYDVPQKKVIHSIQVGTALTSLAWAGDGVTVAVGGSNGRIAVYDLRMLSAGAGAPLSLAGHTGAVSCLRFQHSGSKSTSTSATRPAVSASLSSSAILSPPFQDITPSPSIADTQTPSSNLLLMGPSPATSDNNGSIAARRGLFPSTPTTGEEPVSASGKARRPLHVALLRSEADVLSPLREDDLHRRGVAVDQGATTSPASLDSLRSSVSRATNGNTNLTLPTTHSQLASPPPIMDHAISPPPPHAAAAATTTTTTTTPTPTPSRVPDTNTATRSLPDNLNPTTETVPAKQVSLLRGILEESLDEFRRSIHQDITNLHVEVLRQFHVQQTEMAALFERYSEHHASLISEVERLRQEIHKNKL